MGEAGHIYFPFAGGRVSAFDDFDDGGKLDCASATSTEGGQMVPAAATALSGAIQLGAWDERFTEGHGNYYDGAGGWRTVEFVQSTVLGDHLLPFGNGRRNDGRGLANHQDHGPANYETDAVRRILRGDGRRADAGDECRVRDSG